MPRRTQPRWKKEHPADAYRWFLERFERAMPTPAPTRRRDRTARRPGTSPARSGSAARGSS